MLYHAGDACMQDILASHLDSDTEAQSAIVILLNVVAQVIFSSRNLPYFSTLIQRCCLFALLPSGFWSLHHPPTLQQPVCITLAQHPKSYPHQCFPQPARRAAAGCGMAVLTQVQQSHCRPFRQCPHTTSMRVLTLPRPQNMIRYTASRDG